LEGRDEGIFIGREGHDVVCKGQVVVVVVVVIEEEDAKDVGVKLDVEKGLYR
jgi:hypothetical protein